MFQGDHLVSVIVPVYNVEQVLHYCVDSILNQTYEDFELILVNDGSTDSSGVICDEYAHHDNRVRVIHKENEGVSSARNTGIDEAEGQYICFVDSDDYLDRDYLFELIHAKESTDGFDNIWCGFQTVTDYTGSDRKVYLSMECEEVSFFDKKQIMTLHEKWMDPMPWNKLFCRNIIIDHQISFSEDLSLGEDFLFNLQYLDCSNGKIMVINKPLNFYLRSGNESLDNKYYPDLFEIYKRILSKLYDYLSKWECDADQFAKYYHSCFYSYEKVLHNTFHEKSDIKQKFRFNQQVLKSLEFMEAFQKSDCFIHPFYRFAYKCKSSRMVRVLDLLLKLKKR